MFLRSLVRLEIDCLTDRRRRRHDDGRRDDVDDDGGPANYVYFTLTKVFWAFDLRPKSLTPTWIFNNSVDLEARAGRWMNLPIQIQHPALLPDNVRDKFTVAFLQMGPPQPMVVAGIKHGIFLNRAQLGKLQQILKFALPKKGCGHGKNGHLVKRDFAEALIEHVCPDSSPDEKKRMLQGIMGQQWNHLQRSKASTHSADILKAFGKMDPDEQREFAGLAQVALDEGLLKEHRESRATRTVSTPTSGKLHETPLAMKNLLPSDAQGCRITGHPALKRYQGFYTVPKGFVEEKTGIPSNWTFVDF